MARAKETTSERKVFIIRSRKKPSTCDKCGQELGKGRWIELAGDRGALCMDCSELGKLEFLPSGDAALTRRSKKYSDLWAVVLKWSPARKRYERQGLLVEAGAMEKAYAECMADAQERKSQRAKAAKYRAKKDAEFIDQFAEAIRFHYPACPKGIEKEIADHACRIYSGRVGRSAMAKALAPKAIELAVTAHVRHRHTNYDELLNEGYERFEALQEVRPRIWQILDQWEGE